MEKETKPTNGQLKVHQNGISKRTIVFTWGKYSITLLCFTAIAISIIQKINF